MIVRKVIRVWGRVQGVGFRYFTVGVARRLDLDGTVANLPDGSVEVVVEGREEVIRSFTDRIRTGPPSSRVENLEIRDEEPVGEMNGFEIVF